MKLMYVGNFDEVEIAATGQTVKAGGTVDVDDALAGRAPSGTVEDSDFDPGAGLLAQVDNWQAAEKKPTTKSAAVAAPNEEQ